MAEQPRWYFKDDNGSFQPYSPFMHIAIDQAYQTNPQLPVIIADYKITFLLNEEGTQTDLLTNKDRDICIVRSVQWQFFHSSAETWKTYPAQTAVLLERNHLAGHQGPVAVARVAIFHLDEMTAESTEYGTFPIRRVASDEAPPQEELNLVICRVRRCRSMFPWAILHLSFAAGLQKPFSVTSLQPEDGGEGDAVWEYFTNCWRKRGVPEPRPCFIAKVWNRALATRYAKYLQTIPLTERREEFFFHGTTSACGSQWRAQKHGCGKTDGTCAVCSILHGGFVKQAIRDPGQSFQRFGAGFYFGLESTKSNDYTEPPSVAGRVASQDPNLSRVILICRCVVGRIYESSQEDPQKTRQWTRAPQGFDSVLGVPLPLNVPKPGLKWPEHIIYSEDAILPMYAVVYHAPALPPGASAPCGCQGV
ncbi:hypothetical protein PAPYR_2623 [Paratrimastix pyriformis]|uniref:WWE domain-containing protein n=1 Tax=Paratrimastix pyriformis TaxID=342808 RepID=A0ABQ8UWL8_9EUKA|nr:hypothetical protein PAPYR_2623 [Paratrimastix pyriformis]